MLVAGFLLLLSCVAPSTTTAFTPSSVTRTARDTTRLRAADTFGADVATLLQNNERRVASLGAAVPDDVDDVTLLRFALAFPTQIEAKRALRETLGWRRGAGKNIVESAARAVQEAAVSERGWDNTVVRDAAPHAAAINRYITSKNILTLSSTADDDLVYVIRAASIDDKALMNDVSVDQLLDFFLYVKEVHNIVANERSQRTGRLCSVIFANDISGVSAIPDQKFTQALTESSNQYEKLYPSLAGPTMILNLPGILQAFISFFKPLFPKSVQDRLLFESAPFLASVDDMTRLTTDQDARGKFLAEVKALL